MVILAKPSIGTLHGINNSWHINSEPEIYEGGGGEQYTFGV